MARRFALSASAASSGTEHRPEERTLIAHDALGFFCVLEGSETGGIVKRLLSILFIFGQARKGEQGKRDVARALRRQEVAVMLASELLHKWNPELAVRLELSELARMQNVSDKTGDHFLLLLPVEAAGLVLATCIARFGGCTVARRERTPLREAGNYGRRPEVERRPGDFLSHGWA